MPCTGYTRICAHGIHRQAGMHASNFKSATFTDVSTFTDDTPASKSEGARKRYGIFAMRFRFAIRNQIAVVCMHFVAAKRQNTFYSSPGTLRIHF